MDSKTAWKTFIDFYKLKNPSDEQVFLYTESMKYIIETEKDPDVMLSLGGHYYGRKRFDLALRYYEMAAAYDLEDAYQCLGYIWYYGRTGHVDYKKAYECFCRGYEKGDLTSSYKIADMYKNGYYVEKDFEKYRSIIEELYPKVKDARMLEDPLPEIFTRLAGIRSDEGNVDEALRLYDIARDFLAQRIRVNPFFGNLNIMKWTIWDIYKLREFDPDYFELYDLYYILQNPAKVSFWFEDKAHEVESVKEDGEPAIRFDDKWFRDVDDFFKKAELDGELLTTRYEELYDFEVL